MVDQFVNLVVWAATGSFTPGPNNTIAALTGTNFGWRAALPHIMAVPAGFTTLLLISMTGIAALLHASPSLTLVLKIASVAYLLWLSWGLITTRSPTLKSGAPFALPLNFTQSFLFQFLNPKGWLYALTGSGLFFAIDRPWYSGTLLVLVFSLCGVVSVLLWSLAGSSLRSWLSQGQRLRRFNQGMGVLLALTALLILR